MATIKSAASKPKAAPRPAPKTVAKPVDHLAAAAKHGALADQHRAIADSHMAKHKIKAINSGAKLVESDWGLPTIAKAK